MTHRTPGEPRRQGRTLVAGAHAQQGGTDPALNYDAQTRGPVPIPPSERGLQAVVADPWFKVSDEGLVLEGPAFDRAGNLLFCDVSGRRVLRLTPDKRLSTVVREGKLGPGGLAIHKDGRLFIAAMDTAKGIGSIAAVKPDGSEMQAIVPPEAGYMPNDLVFDSWGGFYFTDFRGASTEPKGGVYYVSPAFDRWGNTAHRWGHRSDSYSWALRGTGRAAVVSGTNAVRGRCVHEHHGPW
jgi:lactonase